MSEMAGYPGPRPGAEPGGAPAGDAGSNPGTAGGPPTDAGGVPSDASSRRGPKAPGPPVCEGCGSVMYDRHCKIVCPRCGYLRDCSDP